MRIRSLNFLLLLAGGVFFALSACDSEGPAERQGRKSMKPLNKPSMRPRRPWTKQRRRQARLAKKPSSEQRTDLFLKFKASWKQITRQIEP